MLYVCTIIILLPSDDYGGAEVHSSNQNHDLLFNTSSGSNTRNSGAAPADAAVVAPADAEKAKNQKKNRAGLTKEWRTFKYLFESREKEDEPLNCGLRYGKSLSKVTENIC